MSNYPRFAAVLCFALSACSAATSTVVGSAGGIVVGDGATLTIPPGALDRDQTISITALDDAAPAGYVLASRVFRFAPEGLMFLVPATVEIPLDAAVPARLYWTRPSSSDFEELAATATGTTLTGLITHFSKGFGGQPASPDGGGSDGATPRDLNSTASATDLAAEVDDFSFNGADFAVPDLFLTADRSVSVSDLSKIADQRASDLAARDGGRDGRAPGDLASNVACPADAATLLDIPTPALPCKQIPGWDACIELNLQGAVGPIDLVLVQIQLPGTEIFSVSPAMAPPITVGIGIAKDVFLDTGQQIVPFDIVVTAFAHGQVVAQSGHFPAQANEHGAGFYAVPLMAAVIDHCFDSITDDGETDTDCGGSCVRGCEEGWRCRTTDDCVSDSALFCNCGICEKHCADGVRDFDETDIDCGGSCGATCAIGELCGSYLDCGGIECLEPALGSYHTPAYFFAASCFKGKCAESCSDGAQDGYETDIDCGSSNNVQPSFVCQSPIPTCKGCAKGKGCWANKDCLSGTCSNLRVCD